MHLTVLSVDAVDFDPNFLSCVLVFHLVMYFFSSHFIFCQVLGMQLWKDGMQFLAALERHKENPLIAPFYFERMHRFDKSRFGNTVLVAWQAQRGRNGIILQ